MLNNPEFKSSIFKFIKANMHNEWMQGQFEDN